MAKPPELCMESVSFTFCNKLPKDKHILFLDRIPQTVNPLCSVTRVPQTQCNSFNINPFPQITSPKLSPGRGAWLSHWGCGHSWYGRSGAPLSELSTWRHGWAMRLHETPVKLQSTGSPQGDTSSVAHSYCPPWSKSLAFLAYQTCQNLSISGPGTSCFLCRESPASRCCCDFLLPSSSFLQNFARASPSLWGCPNHCILNGSPPHSLL